MRGQRHVYANLAFTISIRESFIWKRNPQVISQVLKPLHLFQDCCIGFYTFHAGDKQDTAIDLCLTIAFRFYD